MAKLEYFHPSIALHVVRSTLKDLTPNERIEFFKNACKDGFGTNLRYRNSTNPVELRDGRLCVPNDDGSVTYIDRSEVKHVFTRTSAYMGTAFFKFFVEGNVVATRKRKVMNTMNLDSVYEVVVKSVRNKFPNIDSMECFHAPVLKDYR